MKKNFLYALMAVALLSGCNNVNEVTDPNYPGLDEEGNEPVEVILGTQSPNVALSRASVTADNWAGTSVGVLALAKNTGADFTTSGGCLLNTTGTIGAGAGNPITLAGANKFYYPLGNEMNYSFFGFYPAVTPTVGTNQVSLTYTLDGTQDLLVARAAVDDKLVVGEASFDGYNARYFRKGGDTPNLTFKHLLSKLTFNIIAGVSSEGTTDAAKKIKVTSIKIVGAKNSALVSLPYGKDNENIALNFNQGEADFTLKEMIGGEEKDAKAVYPADIVDGVGVMMGSGIMLSPGETTYKMSITVEDAAGVAITSPYNITFPGNAKSVAGTAYRINMTINGLEEIKLTTTLTDWITGADIDLEL